MSTVFKKFVFLGFGSSMENTTGNRNRTPAKSHCILKVQEWW